MPRLVSLVSLVIFATLIAAPALAQVINGETPLDETTLNRETPGPETPTASRTPDAPASKHSVDPAPTERR